jgi:hypothetical protein
MLSRYTLWGRRKDFRRDEDLSQKRYVDQYNSIWLLPLVFIIGLNCLDYFFTMIILENNGTELNPIVAAVIQYCQWDLLTWKFTVVSLGALIMCLHSQYVKVKIAIIGIFLLYLGVVGYQYIGLMLCRI